MTHFPTTEPSNRHVLPRVVAGALAVLATPSAIRDLYGLLRGGFDPLLAVFAACTAMFVALCAWFALRGHEAVSRARMKLVLLGALVVGASGLSVGFCGPGRPGPTRARCSGSSSPAPSAA